MFDEGAHLGVLGSKQPRDVSNGAVADPHPDHSWRWAAENAESVEVAVLRDQNETFRRRASPDCVIASASKAEIDNVRRVWIQVGKVADQARREMPVEEDPQHSRGWPAAARLRCRNAGEPTLPVRGEGETSANVVARELREVGDDLIHAHPAREVREDVAHGDARTPHDGLPERDFGVDDDAVTIVHEGGRYA